MHQVERCMRWGIGALLRGELDVLLGAAGGAPAEIASRLIRREPILLGMASDHPLAGTTIERLTAEPAPADDAWRHELTAAMDALDALEKPFAPFDRCVTNVRERFGLARPHVSVAA